MEDRMTVIALLLISITIQPQNIDRYTGRVRLPGSISLVAAANKPKPLSEDTVPVRWYPTGTESTLVLLAGIDHGAGPDSIWSVATWFDTVHQNQGDLLLCLDAATNPGVETLAVRRVYSVMPETATAIDSTWTSPPMSSIVVPTTRFASGDTLFGMTAWTVSGFPLSIETRNSVWYTELDSSAIARFVPESALLSEWRAPTPGGFGLVGICPQAETVWYTNPDCDLLGRLVPAENGMCEWVVPGTGFAGVGWPGLDRDPGGRIWVTRRRDDHFIGRVKFDAQGTAKFDLWYLPYQLCDGPCDVLVAEDGKVWYSVMGVDSNYLESRIGRLDPATRQISEWSIPTPGAGPYYLELDAQGDCWFIESDSNKVGKLDPHQNTITEFSPPLGAEGTTYDFALDGAGSVWMTPFGRGLVKIVGVAGIAEAPHNPLFADGNLRFGTSIVRNALYWPNKEKADLLDISGRKVAELKPGINDLSRIAPSVYFVRSPARSAITKVILGR
jgi:virginiamycin B lyase